jgi:hypothetical protein
MVVVAVAVEVGEDEAEDDVLEGRTAQAVLRGDLGEVAREPAGGVALLAVVG